MNFLFSLGYKSDVLIFTMKNGTASLVVSIRKHGLIFGHVLLSLQSSKDSARLLNNLLSACSLRMILIKTFLTLPSSTLTLLIVGIFLHRLPLLFTLICSLEDLFLLRSSL